MSNGTEVLVISDRIDRFKLTGSKSIGIKCYLIYLLAGDYQHYLVQIYLSLPNDHHKV
ncbi:Uncharacterised protein [Chlamydia abortus]|nr:Uncharacterised protein [Chlamydia abortus]